MYACVVQALLVVVALERTHSAAPFIERCDILDLSYALGDSTVILPGVQPFKLLQILKGIHPKDGFFEDNIYVEINNFKGAEHAGTHIDAPSHFVRDAASVDKIEPNRLVGEACVIHASDRAAQNRDYQITVDDLQKWETTNGRISDSCILLIDSGWGRLWNDPAEFLGGDPSRRESHHYPGISEAATQWILENRSIRSIGVDVPSIDGGQSRSLRSHQLLLRRGIPILENVANLDRLPSRGATAIFQPMKIENGSGGPLRGMAIGWNGAADPCRRTAVAEHSLHEL